MSFIRAVTLTVILSFVLVASAFGTFVYLLSGYPSPEVDNFRVNSTDTGDRLIADVEASVRNIGGEGEVRVEVRSLDEQDRVIDSRSQTAFMAYNETRVFNESFNAEEADDIGLAVFAPERPDLIRDESEIVERIPMP
ncbi:MAG: hypothetical protein ACLFTA_03165 [Candidatus Nanohaloarchaea archaeon]